MTEAFTDTQPELRHRPPFVFHEVIEDVGPESAVGTVRIGANSVHYCDAGFVDGIDLIEALAQVCGIHNRSLFPDLGQGYLMAADDVGIGAAVARPCVIRLSSTLIEQRGTTFVYNAKAVNVSDGAIVAAGHLTTFRSGEATLGRRHADSVDGWRLLNADHIAEDRKRAASLRDWERRSDGASVHRRYDPTETFFLGHFPDEPIVPGILHIKEMIRACGHYLGSSAMIDGVVERCTLEKARFNKPAVPGDDVEYKCTVTEESDVDVKFRCMSMSERRKLSTLNINVLKTNC